VGWVEYFLDGEVTQEAFSNPIVYILSRHCRFNGQEKDDIVIYWNLVTCTNREG